VRSALHDAAAAGDTLPVYRISPPEPWRAIRAKRWLAESGQSYPRSELAAEGYFTSSSGITIYRGAAYPKQYYGQMFLGEVAGNMIHRQSLTPEGVTFKAERIDDKSEFAASTDNWFRPVNFVNAPDGTLHVLDMYRETIEHPWSIPDDIKAHLDLESGRDRGRIYRLSPPGFKVPKQPRLSKAHAAELVATLENPNSWWRDTAHRLLYERQDSAAIAPLKALLRNSKSPLGRLHALWSLEGLQALGDDDLLVAINDASGGVREHAVKLAEPRLEKPQLLAAVLQCADDSEPRVRFQTAFTLGETSDPRAVQALAAIARRDGEDDWIRTAVLSSCAGTADALALELLTDAEYAQQPAAPLMVRSLCTILGVKRDAAAAERVITQLAKATSAGADALAMAAVSGMGEGFKRRGQTLSSLFSKNAAAAELVTRLTNDAQQVALDDALTPPQREAAIGLLAYVDFQQSRAALEKLIDPKQPRLVQAAAVRVLSGYVHPDVAGLLLSRWSTYTPPLRTEVVEALAARADRVPALLDALESRKISTSDLSPTRRTLLLRHADLKLRERAATLFAHDAPSPRSEVITQYQSVLSTASDRTRGQKIFERECLTCHKLGDKGHEVGPNLATIRHRTPQEVLAHVLDPNREVAPNYLEYVVALDDGRVATGLIASETATSLSLRAADNKQETILRQNIDEIQSTGKSLMPEGFEKKINPQEMADLLAFLLGLR
jgi:putative heme-binding domain-containing protein